MNKPVDLTWEADVRLITHPLMLANFAKLFAIAGGIMAALMSFMMAITNQLDHIVWMLEFVGICLGTVIVLFFLISLVVFRNRMHFRFRVDDKSAGVEIVDKRAETANAVAMVVGVLEANPTLLGAGLIGKSTSKQQAVWSSIEGARYHPSWLTISLSNGWRTVINLFCTPENYTAVAAAVHDALAAQPVRAQHKSPLPMMLLRTVLVIAACIPLFFLPHLDESAMLPALLTMAMGLTAVWLIPVAAWAVLGCLGWLVVLEAISLSETRTSMFGEVYRIYDMLSADDLAALAFAAIGSTYLVWLCIAFMRRRVRSGLMGDMTDMQGNK
jgi:hypothetical protein